MLRAWESLPHAAPCLTELATVAHLYAEAGNSKAEALIESLYNHLPTEAESLQGILAWKQHKTSESAQRLAAAVTRLRSDPWVLDHIRAKTFDAAVGVAKADPAQAATLLQAFREPLAVYYADESRRGTASVIAEELSPATAAQFVESFEPHVPSSRRLLQYRLQVYRAAGLRLADQADRDLRQFDRCAGSAE